jgi:hypothetical protein
MQDRSLYHAPLDALGAKCPDAMEQLGQLDDMVFEAIAGRPGAMEALRTLWPQVKAKVGAALVEESREQYVRHAMQVWRDCIEGDDERSPAMAVKVMDVVSLLFDE